MNGQFEIVYCQLSDGTPCANWQWRGKTPAEVAVLEHRGARTGAIKTLRHGSSPANIYVRTVRMQERYADWTAHVKRQRAEGAAIVRLAALEAVENGGV